MVFAIAIGGVTLGLILGRCHQSSAAISDGAKKQCGDAAVGGRWVVAHVTTRGKSTTTMAIGLRTLTSLLSWMMVVVYLPSVAGLEGISNSYSKNETLTDYIGILAPSSSPSGGPSSSPMSTPVEGLEVNVCGRRRGMSNRTATINSSLLTSTGVLTNMSQSLRGQVEQHIRATIGPTHTDENGEMQVIVTTLDVKDGSFSGRDAVANPPAVHVKAWGSLQGMKSTIPTSVGDLTSVSRSLRAQLEQHIRATIGPTHTDENGEMQVIVTTLDVKDDSFSGRDAMANPPAVLVKARRRLQGRRQGMKSTLPTSAGDLTNVIRSLRKQVEQDIRDIQATFSATLV
jgi:hypothetical protein